MKDTVNDEVIGVQTKGQKDNGKVIGIRTMDKRTNGIIIKMVDELLIKVVDNQTSYPL